MIARSATRLLIQNIIGMVRYNRWDDYNQRFAFLEIASTALYSAIKDVKKEMEPALRNVHEAFWNFVEAKPASRQALILQLEALATFFPDKKIPAESGDNAEE